MKAGKTTKIIDYIDALGMAGLLVSVNGESACSSVISYISDPDKKASAARQVTDITYDSRAAGKGSLFVCKGAHFREKFLEDAVAAGAVCYVRQAGDEAVKAAASACSIDAENNGQESDGRSSDGQGSAGKGTGDCFTPGKPVEILVSDIRDAMPVIAATFYGKLSDELKMIGITGTKGKSTTAYYMRFILDEWMAATGGRRSAICSGIDNYDGVIEEESHLTTPELFELCHHMDNALKKGITYMTMEVSSQGLKYDRVKGVDFEAGAFLNIGSDHISAIEHPDFNDYLESKLKIFGHCRKACYNLDCDEQERIKAASADCPYVITFSCRDDSADVYGYDVRSEEGKVSLRIRGKDIRDYADFDEEFTLGTFGTINVENALAAVSLSALAGVPLEYVKSGLAKAISPGRMEVFYSEDGKRIAIVDYAHNKLSYERFFETIRDEFPDKKMIIVFGCPGGKAFARREELGTIAGKCCEYTIVTEEDYGEEDVNKICREIGEFVAAAGGRFEIITDRVEAIKKAITLMDDDTILFLPGKGRETREKRGIEYIDTPSDADVVIEYMK